MMQIEKHTTGLYNPAANIKATPSPDKDAAVEDAADSVAQDAVEKVAQYAADNVAHKNSLGWFVTAAHITFSAKAAKLMPPDPGDVHWGLQGSSQAIGAKRAKR